MRKPESMSGFALKTGLLCRSVLASGTLSPPVVRAMSVVSLRGKYLVAEVGAELAASHHRLPVASFIFCEHAITTLLCLY
eukprot:g11790.t1